MPATVSGEESGSVLSVLDIIFKPFGITLTDHIVRKLAHFSEYTLIGGLLLSCAYSFDRKKPHRFLGYVALAGLAIPLIDETIQLFVEGRAGLVVDIWIDFGGVCMGTLVMLAFYAIYRRIKKFN